MSRRGKEKQMITEINDGGEEGRTTESEDVEMLVRCEVRYGTRCG